MGSTKPASLFCCALSLFFFLSEAVSSQQKIAVNFEGTVKDADGQRVPDGKVQVSFTGGGTLLKPIKDGEFKFTADVPGPADKNHPLIIKLTFYADDKAFGPPRSIEHLSPRLPKSGKQELHVVMYTDDQLRRADLGQLYAEAQQLEASFLAWLQSDATFKEKNRDLYSLKRLDDRRQLIVRLWPDAAPQSPLPKEVKSALLAHFAEKSQLANSMKKYLPKD